MAEPSGENVRSLARMWGMVFLANMAGTLFAALFCTFTPVLTPELRAGMIDISSQIMHVGWLEAVFRAIGAGFLIAAMVWLIPAPSRRNSTSSW